MMKMPAFFTKVPSFSRILAVVLFVMLPFVGFFLGMQYQILSTFRFLDEPVGVDTGNLKE